jgi:hypothetical protein
MFALSKSKTQKNKNKKMKQTASLIRKFSFVVLSITLALASCSKKDSGIAASNAGPFAGQYLVVDEDESYTLKIESDGGSSFKITNFGGFMNVPVKANANGNVLTIPTQTFKNPNGHTLTVSGTGSLITKGVKDDTITISYTISGFANYSGDLEGSRQ